VVFTLGQTAPKLGITLRTDQESYSLHSKIQLVIVRENQGDQDLLVPREWGWGVMRTNIRVFGAQGKEVRTSFLADELPPPPQSWDFILLEAGQFVGTRVKESVRAFRQRARRV
jgi:hypothetical protein